MTHDYSMSWVYLHRLVQCATVYTYIQCIWMCSCKTRGVLCVQYFVSALCMCLVVSVPCRLVQYSVRVSFLFCCLGPCS